MRIEEIVESLVNHDISKKEAVIQLKIITNSLMKKGGVLMQVETVAFTSENGHGILELKAPYQYDKIKHFKKGDLADVTLHY